MHLLCFREQGELGHLQLSHRLLFAVLLLVQLHPPLLLSLAVLVLAVVVGSYS